MNETRNRAGEPTVEQTLHYIDTVRDAVILQLEAGSNPVVAMFTACDLIDAWAAVHIDGCADYIYHLRDKRRVAQLTAVIGEMHLQQSEDRKQWQDEREQLAREADRLRGELQTLEADLIEGRTAQARKRVKAKRDG